ncbi:MAG: hypothetical protein ACK44D_02545, partial [Bacteroidia bacterium]
MAQIGKLAAIPRHPIYNQEELLPYFFYGNVFFYYICPPNKTKMLRKFKVSNFKSFEKDFELDLTDVNAYEFNKNSIKNGIVNNAVIYGYNGIGKSNLALAIFDIIEHLTDKQRNETAYKNYLNAYCNSEVACFYYEFLIDSKIVVYEYKKKDYKTIVYERFLIDDNELACFDRLKDSSATISFQGAETLKTIIDNNELSILKYIKNNTQLLHNEINDVFFKFFTFIERMLYFRSLQDRFFMGLKEEGKSSILENIIENN